MFDIGWSEMAIIFLVALIVIGPRDLPRVARTMGQWVRKARRLARDFQNSLEDMAREAELDKVKNEIERAGRTDVKKSVEKTIDPEGDLGRAFDPTEGGGKRRTAGAAEAEAREGDAQGGETAAGPGKDDGARAKTADREKVPAESG